MGNWLILLDLDGTITDFAGRIAGSTVRAIQRAKANGHVVVLCTGRASAEIPRGIWDLGFDGAITAGGARVELAGAELATEPIPNELLSELVQHCVGANSAYCLYSEDDLHPGPQMRQRFGAIAERLLAGGLPSAGHDAIQVSPREHPLLRRTEFTDWRAAGPIVKGLFLNDAPEALTEFREAFAGRLHVTAASVPGLGAGSGEFTRAGIDKGTSVQLLLNQLGIEHTRSLGIGDSFNDLALLRACGVGVAMGSAEAALRAIADHVTDGVLDNGIWNALSQLGLIE